jgi:hypothetical protein
MRSSLWLAVSLAAASLAAHASLAPASTRPAWFAPVAVSSPARPSLHGPLRINFAPRALPRGGFYYAVLVLSNYPSGTGARPSCAVSSDMGKTQYGFPRSGARLRLSVLPARSGAETWCPGGTYLGAVYAVPHRPLCSYSQPCYGRTTQVGACWIVGEGRRVCGVVIRPRYSYPGGLPRPLDASSRLVTRFVLRFPSS